MKGSGKSIVCIFGPPWITSREINQYLRVKAAIHKGRCVCIVTFLSAIDNKREYPNSMVGEYSIDRLQPTQPPMLYLVDVDCIDAPTIGMSDVYGNKKGNNREDWNHLFLFRKRKDWPVAWDSIIDSVYLSRRNPLPDKAYEKGGSHSEERPPHKKRRSKQT